MQRSAPAPLGPCPICSRPMFSGPSTNRHHFVPVSEGGTVAQDVHAVCHSKIHSAFSERDLATLYDTPEKLLATEEIAAFVRWVAKKDPLFVDRSVRANAKGPRKGR